MNFSNLHLEIKPIQYQEKLSQETSQILVLSKKEHVKDLKLSSPLLLSKIEKTFEEKINKIITHIDDKEYFICILQSDQFHDNSTTGKKLYLKLKEEEINEAFFKGLNLPEKSMSMDFLEGLYYESYQFKAYKKENKIHKLTTYLTQTVYEDIEVDKIKNISESIAYTRTLVNLPPNKLDAQIFADEVIKAGKHFGFETEIFHKAKITEFGMGGLLAVNQGSDVPPTFNTMTYKPENAVNTKPIVLVGKGVMFDTGGYSLKVKGSMSTMKADMGGGATVLGIISAIAKNKLPYHVIGLVPATDNKINGRALLVDDVITMMDGTNVEVQNTDAEGRLILADALVYAQKLNPELVIDIATLTGAAAAITGPFGVASATNHQEDLQELKKAGHRTYERLVELPMWDELADLLKSDVADLKNIGGSTAGASTAALFLRNFTNYNWIHLDIAGAAFLKQATDSLPSGATGVGVKLVYDYIENKINPKM